jgi:hypothetical protein
MNKRAINKELTELLGECWHEEVTAETMGLYKCSKCDDPFYYNDELDYFTDEGYGKLRDVYDGWDEKKRARFMAYILRPLLATKRSHEDISDLCFIVLMDAFHRDNLAPLMLEFLKGKG